MCGSLENAADDIQHQLNGGTVCNRLFGILRPKGVLPDGSLKALRKNYQVAAQNVLYGKLEKNPPKRGEKISS